MDIERLQELAGIEPLLNEGLTISDADRFIRRKADPETVIPVPPKVVKDMKDAAEKELDKTLKAKGPAEIEVIFKRLQFFVSAAKILEQAQTDTFIMAIIFQRGSQQKVKFPKSFDTLRKKFVEQSKRVLK